MAVNKVVLASGETLVDLTGTTVTPSTLAVGYTALDKTGELIHGTMVPGEGGGSGGAYNAESIILDDGTQKIRIVDAEGGGVTPEPVGGMRMDSSFLGNTFKFYPRLNLLFDRIQLPDQVEPIYEIVILEE